MTDARHGKPIRNEVSTVFMTCESTPNHKTRHKKMADRASITSATSETPILHRKRFFKEVVAAIIINLGPVCMGFATGYSSPAVADIQRNHRSISLNDQEQSFFGSFMTIGALIGGLIAGILVDIMGRKLCLMFICCPFVMGWMLIVYSNQASSAISMVYAGRILTGICVGVMSMCAPVYVSEIASPEIRGTLGSCFQLCMNTGILLVYCLGAGISWTYLALASAVAPVILLFLLIPLPESPTWLIKKKQKLEAIDSLIWLRGKTANVQEEADEIEMNCQNDSNMSLLDFLRPELWKPFLLMFMEMFFQQFSGINSIIFNISVIFSAASKSIDSNLSAIIIGIVGVVATFGALFFIDRAGRRILLMVSGFFMGVSLIALGGYYYAQFHDASSVKSISWLPIICLIVFITAFNLGFGPVPWLMMGEVFPSQAKGLASSIIAALNWTLAFVVTKTYQDLLAVINNHGVFWLYGGVCLLSVLYTWKFVPETKGKTFQEIRELFVNRQPLVYDIQGDD